MGAGGVRPEPIVVRRSEPRDSEDRRRTNGSQSDRGSPATGHRKVLLISNQTMHYRVSIYNYFNQKFRECGYELSVLTDRLQGSNRRPLEFDLRELPFDFRAYRKAILAADPAVVILFLHLKDSIIWPLIHWLKLRGIPFAFWTKGGNWDAKPSRLRYELFNYVHGMADALILYSDSCHEFVKPRFRSKAFVANNTINFEDFPVVRESKEEIKKEFGIPFEKVVISVGRMGVGNGRKRVDHLIDVFRGLDREDVGLVLVGSGMEDGLRKRMKRRNTMYLGEVHDERDLQINKLFKMADICVIPGHVGLGLNHAFYWGLPVVTEDCEQPPEIGYLKPGRNGFIVPRNDLAQLRKRILQLLDQDDLRAECSKHARADILAEASISGMFAGFRNCVNYLTGSR